MKKGRPPMSKSIQILTLIVLTTVLIGCLLIPNNPIFWLATATPAYAVARGLLIFIIYAFLLFGVPQNAIIKRMIVALSLSLLGWALVSTYNETTQLLDGLSIAAAGISLTLAALEPDYANRAEENWDVITSPVIPHFKRFERRAVYYTLVAYMLFDILARSLQPGHQREKLLS